MYVCLFPSRVPRSFYCCTIHNRTWIYQRDDPYDSLVSAVERMGSLLTMWNKWTQAKLPSLKNPKDGPTL